MSHPPPSPQPDEPLRPVPRSYKPPSGARDRDAFQSAQNLRMALWSLLGIGLGLVGGALAGHPLLGAVGGGTAFFLFLRLVVDASGSAASRLHAPSGASTPHAREHSRAESLVVRGHYREAVDAFREALEEDPSDPTPYLRLARIHRDNLGELETAAGWLRRALREGILPAGMATLARRELVELYIHRMGEPRRAAPELARMAEELAGTEDGRWAARELAAVKAAMREGEG